MAQETFVGKFDPARARDLADRLAAEGFAPRTVPHALVAATRPDLVVTLYGTGKIVVQGAAARAFGARLAGAVPLPETGAALGPEVIGTDESGKGDYFGPLVAAAVYASPRQREEMARGEVDDSKKLSDETVARLAGAIGRTLPNAVVALLPEEYNRRYEEAGNVNRLLASLHAEAILRVARRVRCRRVLTDAFGDASLVRGALGAAASRFDLHQRPRAEEDPAVAAASILARDAFVRGLARLSEEFAIDLPKGAGGEVDAAARRFVAIHGPDALRRVAKVHFKTTGKISRLF
ncbi:MAG TPA: ribonuclease HIII [Planctomycetota bacterium]|nr:ribonuclease HIII [Planctomycetota bacterium]